MIFSAYNDNKKDGEKRWERQVTYWLVNWNIIKRERWTGGEIVTKKLDNLIEAGKQKNGEKLE